MTEYIINAFKLIMSWAGQLAQDLIGRDLTNWDILATIAFARNGILFCDNIIPIVACMKILLIGFAAKVSVMFARYLIGWIPGIEG